MVKISNLQIVNGCQTATALAHAARDGTLRPDTRVLLKIFETTDPSLASRIVLTTNNQNRISTRDLKANDAVQQDMQRRFESYNLLYEHKANQYATTTLTVGQRIVSNEDVGQAFLAIALKKPGDARRRNTRSGLTTMETFSVVVASSRTLSVSCYTRRPTLGRERLVALQESPNYGAN